MKTQSLRAAKLSLLAASLSSCLLAFTSPARAQGQAEDVLINEVDSDTPTAPVNDAFEFVELYDGGIGMTPLDGLVLVFFNGNGDSSYRAIDLDGFTTNANGFFVAGNTGVPNVGVTFPPNTLQNGGDAVALYLGNAADFPTGTPVTSSALLDSVVYGRTSDAIATGLLGGLLFGSQINEGANNMGADDSIARSPDGGTAFDDTAWVTQAPTPGVTNVTSLEISLFPTPSTLTESGGATVSTVMVTLDGEAPTSDLTLTLTNSDSTELSIPETVIIPAGMTTGSFNATVIDDLWPDGDQMVTITASAVGYFEGIAIVTVQDDGDSDPGIVINEIYATVDSSGGDANQDGMIGASDGSDEFVELVNNTAGNLDLSGYTLSDFATVRHTFPNGTVLEPGCAIVVFGGGNILEGRLAAFGGAVVQKANGSNTFGLSLNNAGDMVSIRNPSGAGGLEVAGYSFGASGSTFGNTTTSLGSFARNPDITGEFELGAYTAGYTREFNLFCPLPNDLSTSLSMDSVLENVGSVTLTVSVFSAPASDLTLMLSSSNPNAATVPATATIPSGMLSTDVTVTVLNNAFQNGDVVVTLVASADGFLTGTSELTIMDDGDPSVDIFINEVDYDPEGTDVADSEFVELYDGGVGNVPLDGLVLVLYNGNEASDSAYGVIDLAGAQTNASGFYVITTAANGIQNGGTGGDGMALFRGAAAGDFTGTSASAPPLGAEIVDSLVYEAGDAGLVAPLNYTGPDLNDSDDAEGISRIPDGTGPFQLVALTRGFSNGSMGATGYATWATGFPGIGGPTIDDEFDGIANLLEYLFGKNPLESDPSPGLVPVINGSGNPQVTITKDAGAGADPLLNAVVEVTTNLTTGSWTTTDTNVLTDSATSLVVEYTGASPVIFMRVVATYP